MTVASPDTTMLTQLLLREMIVAGSLSPSSELVEEALGAELGVPPAVVRGAFDGLLDEGLLERNAEGELTVRGFTVADALDAIEVRGVLEGTAVRLAAERGVPVERLDTLEQIVNAIDRCVDIRSEALDFERFEKLNYEFHAALREISGSFVLEQELQRVWKLPFASPSAFVRQHWRGMEFRMTLATAQAQHRAIFDAISNREGSRAEALAREHARLARQNVQAAWSGQKGTTRTVPGLTLKMGLL